MYGKKSRRSLHSVHVKNLCPEIGDAFKPFIDPAILDFHYDSWRLLGKSDGTSGPLPTW